jgi:hypothetical protein
MIASSAVLVTLLAQGAGAAPFRAFDSRLRVQIVALGQDTRASSFRPIGGGGLWFNYGDRILLRTAEGYATLKPPVPLRDLVVLEDGSSWAVSASGLMRIEQDGAFTPGPLLPAGARLAGGGGKTFLVAREEGGRSLFTILRPDGAQTELASIPGALHAFDWGPDGLFAIVGESLYYAGIGDRNLLRLRSHAGLAQVEQIVGLGPRRALLAFPLVVALLSDSYVVPVVVVSAEVRRLGDHVFFRDRHGGLIWMADGWSQLGDPARDAAYVKELLAANCVGDVCAQRLESVRLSQAIEDLDRFRARERPAASPAHSVREN